jgi:hypothetical protein
MMSDVVEKILGCRDAFAISSRGRPVGPALRSEKSLDAPTPSGPISVRRSLQASKYLTSRDKMTPNGASERPKALLNGPQLLLQ